MSSGVKGVSEDKFLSHRLQVALGHEKHKEGHVREIIYICAHDKLSINSKRFSKTISPASQRKRKIEKHRKGRFSTTTVQGYEKNEEEKKIVREKEKIEATIEKTEAYLLERYGLVALKIAPYLCDVVLKSKKIEGHFLRLEEFIKLDRAGKGCADFLPTLDKAHRILRFFIEQDNFSEEQLKSTDLIVKNLKGDKEQFDLEKVKKTFRFIESTPLNNDEIVNLSEEVRKSLELMHKKVVRSEEIKDTCLRLFRVTGKEILPPQHSAEYNVTLLPVVNYTREDVENYTDEKFVSRKIKVRHSNSKIEFFNVEKLKASIWTLPIDRQGKAQVLTMDEVGSLAYKVEDCLVDLQKKEVRTAEIRSFIVHSLRQSNLTIHAPSCWAEDKGVIREVCDYPLENLKGSLLYKFYRFTKVLEASKEWSQII